MVASVAALWPIMEAELYPVPATKSVRPLEASSRVQIALAVVTGCVPPGCRPRRRAGAARGAA
jgi:hypothetical protein